MSTVTTSMLAGYLTSYAQQRFDRFATTSILDLFSESDVFLEVPETFLYFLSDHRQRLCGLLKRWLFEIDNCPGQHKFIEFLAYNTRKFLKNNNQFLVLTQSKRNDLADVYRQFLWLFYSVLKDDGNSSLANRVIDALKHHRQNLRWFVKSLETPPDRPKRADFVERLSVVPKSYLLNPPLQYSPSPQCSEYSSSLQIKVLSCLV